MEGVRLSQGRPPAGRRYHCARRFVILGFLERERRDAWRLLASFFARSFYTSAGIAQLVEHNLAKVGVAGSNPVSRFISLGSRRHRSSKWRPLAGSVGWLVLLRSGGEIGRREGLKIPWDKLPCGFDPRPEHWSPSDCKTAALTGTVGSPLASVTERVRGVSGRDASS